MNARDDQGIDRDRLREMQGAWAVRIDGATPPFDVGRISHVSEDGQIHVCALSGAKMGWVHISKLSPIEEPKRVSADGTKGIPEDAYEMFAGVAEALGPNPSVDAIVRALISAHEAGERGVRLTLDQIRHAARTAAHWVCERCRWPEDAARVPCMHPLHKRQPIVDTTSERLAGWCGDCGAVDLGGQWHAPEEGRSRW